MAQPKSESTEPSAPSTPEVLVDERLPLSTKLTFGLPSIAGAAIAIPIAVHMPKFYADEVLVPLGWIAIGIAIARALDAITDPMMGWLSDRTKTRWGRRKPWIALGVPLCALALVALWTPPEGIERASAAVWFGCAFIAYYLFHTIYDIPHYGLGAELTLDYNERTSLFGIRAGFIMVGVLLGTLLPGLLDNRGLGQRQVFFLVSSGFAVLLVASYGLLLARIRERPEFVARASNPLVPGVRRALRNRPFRILLLTYVVGSITGAIPGTFMPFYTQYVLEVENYALWLTYFLAAYFASGFLFLPVWVAAARRFGKLEVWLASFGIGIVGGSSLYFMGPGDELLVFGLLVFTGSTFGLGQFLGASMQADVIDYDELHTGKRREAQYGAFWSIATKLIVIPGAAIPLAFLGSQGYVPNQVQSDEVKFWIAAIFAFGPASFSLLALFIARLYPISARVHAEIRLGIRTHDRGEDALDPLTGELLGPPRPGVGDDLAWRLDHFSRRELEALAARRTGWVLGWVALKAVGLLAATTLAWGLALNQILSSGEQLTDVENMVITLLIVGGGILLSLFLFQATRLGTARRAGSAPVDPALVRAHIDALW
jgi:GPH family glycoside/pentoside/hexuronide:cation symporter